MTEKVMAPLWLKYPEIPEVSFFILEKCYEKAGRIKN